MKRKKLKLKKWKTPKIVFRIFFLFLVGLYIQLVYLSISNKVYGQDMEKFAKNRNTVRETLLATRGSIYDNNNEVLAQNVSSYTLFAYLDPKRSKNSSVLHHVKDLDTTAEKLASVLDEDKDYFLKILEKGKKNNKSQVEFGKVGKGLTELTKEKIEALELPGIDFIESQKRYYPNGNFASYVIGYALEKEITEKTDDGDKITKKQIKGELGIESEYNDLLKGKDGYLEYQQDRYGYKITGTNEESIKAQNGYDIYLTIDSNIQRFVENAMKQAVDKYHPELMMITIMDAKNGDILATSAYPSFNPNVRDIKNYNNPFVSYPYEPGSVMKTYTYMCAIENGVYKGNDTFESGKMKVEDDTLNDWNQVGWGRITFDKGFEYSSNVGIAHLMKDYLKKKQLKECLNKYGFGKKTGVELTGEVSGKVEFTYPIEVATAGFGQGISTTAIQQLQALTIISNNGRMLKPHIVDKIVDPNTNKVYYESKKEESEQLVSTQTVSKMKDLMYNVVNGTDSGTTGGSYKIEGFDIIGKTGTAQISEHGKYVYDQYILSFAGMYPKDDPEYIIYAVSKKPNVNSSVTISTAVKDIIISISKYRKVEHTKIEKAENIKVESYINKDKETVVKKLKEKNVSVVVLGNGNKIIKQYPLNGTDISALDKVILYTNDSNIKLPSLKGFSRKEASLVLDWLNKKYEFKGYGYVKNVTEKDNKIILELESRYMESEKNEE